MKIILRIPCREQYAFLEIHDDVTTVDEAVALYQQATMAYKKTLMNSDERFIADLPDIKLPQMNGEVMKGRVLTRAE